jgi:two-component system cell cycle response regulator DivK
MKTPLVLVVEDTEDNLALMRSVLKREACEVIEARDGREALAQAERHRPDVILLDMSLPEVDGWTVARTLRASETFATTRIIAVTAHAMESDREGVMRSGCDGFVTKPLNLREFRILIRELCAPR